jgi:hypothetical protein
MLVEGENLMLEKEDAARRLARAIAHDIRLYNEAKLAGVKTADEMRSALAAEIKEGRELYLARVAPALSHLFDPALDEILLGQTPPTPEPATVGGVGEVSPVGATAEGEGKNIFLLALLGASVIGLLALLFFLLGR